MTATLQAPPSLAVARTVDAAKVYGSGDTAVRALDGVTVEFPQSRFTAIMGPSGSGKSTLMHCLAGLDTLTSGRVLISGTDLGTMSDRQLTRLPSGIRISGGQRPSGDPERAQAQRLENVANEAVLKGVV